MATNVAASGIYDLTKKQSTSYQSYTFFSGALTTTDAFDGNNLDFGVALSEVHFINLSANPAAYQFEELYGTNKASGYIPPNDKIVLRRLNRKSVRVCSYTTGSAASVIVQGN